MGDYAWYNGLEPVARALPQRRRIGIECKRADAPVITHSMRIALADLKLDELRVVYPGTKRYPLAKNVEVRILDLERMGGCSVE